MRNKKNREKCNIKSVFQYFSRENIVWRLLRKNVSVAQIVGYALANLVGLSIVLTALQFYQDISNVWNGDDSFLSKDYIIISKRVAFLDTFMGKVSFSEGEISDIKAQPWADKVGVFTAADFDVSASVDLAGRGMSTYLFLEAIPDEFIDIKPSDWGYTPGEKKVPIILSKEYLTLYNFGFASSRGLPQLSEKAISKVPLKLYIADRRRDTVDVYDARVVGFSSRLNTIAVPYDFITWANDRYAQGGDATPSRVIIETSKPGDPAISEYIDDNDYEVAGENHDNGKMSYFLTIVTIVVVCVGVVISILAFFILLLSIHLLLQKNKDKIQNLMLLGYTPSQIAHHYYMLIGVVNVVVLILTLIIVVVASSMWSAPLDSLGVETSSFILTVIIAIIMMVLVTMGNFYAISRNVKRNFIAETELNVK